jgi:CubicO group peptidase (beta-lactamase class C family)
MRTVAGYLTLVRALLPAAALLMGATLQMAQPSRVKAAGESLTARVDGYLKPLTTAFYFSGNVLIARRNTVLVRRTYGWADQNARIHNVLVSRFRLAGVTQQFTAMAMLMLQERGQLSLQDALCRYLPDCPQTWAGITLDQLLSERSGIFDPSTEDSNFIAGPAGTVDGQIAQAASHPLNFAPGTAHRACSVGYALLGRVIERVSGQSFGGFLRGNILSPLGMSNSGVLEAGGSVPNLSVAFDAYDLAPRTTMDDSWSGAGGAMYSTVDDLYRWDRALVAGSLVSLASSDAMFPTGDEAATRDGYGWTQATMGGRRALWHTGNLLGVQTINLLLPDDGVTVVVLDNQNQTSVDEIASHLVNLIFTPGARGQHGPGAVRPLSPYRVPSGREDSSHARLARG